ncbi:MAG: RsmD family RNA methyltransferase, partial [Candidatus Limnocylindrales bacterium]
MRIVAGERKGARLAAPPGRETRPTPDRVRE